MIEEQVFDTKRFRLTNLLSIGLAISQATIDKVRYKATNIHNLENKISLLENQLKYYKSTQGLVSIFTEHVLKEDHINIQIRRVFYTKSFLLQKLSFQLFILYEENLIWK
jgi:hypothetical protein